MLLPAVVAQHRRVWPWFVGILLVVALAVAGWVFVLSPTAQSQQAANTVAVGATYTYPSGLAVMVSDISTYTSTNPSIISSGDTTYRGTVTLTNGTGNAVNASVMTIDVATGLHSDDRIFENASPPTGTIAPGQQLKVPFAFTVVKQASGPLRVTVAAVLNQPVVFTDGGQ